MAVPAETANGVADRLAAWITSDADHQKALTTAFVHLALLPPLLGVSRLTQEFVEHPTDATNWFDFAEIVLMRLIALIPLVFIVVVLTVILVRGFVSMLASSPPVPPSGSPPN